MSDIPEVVVKLSASPPPPPEPNEPRTPTPETPAAPPATDEPAPPAETPPTPTPKVVAWPGWFGGADFVLAVLALVFGFMLASFVARNSDVWLHLATGKRLLAGEYTPGSDPFSYSGADRAWVNHSLFFDVATYLLYSGSGAALIAIKALFVAAAFGILLGIRKPRFALWPWTLVAAISLVACAPYLHLRPIVGSMFFFAVTLFLLFRLKHVAGSWRFPIAFGVTCWAWANFDEWFFLGPLTVALVLLGELVQGEPWSSRKPESSPQQGDAAVLPVEEPLGPVPDISTLARALGIGLLACMLNPHHVRVWQLPIELMGGPKELSDDIRFRQIVMTPLESLYLDNASLGYNQNGLAYAVLLVAGGAAIGLAGGRVRIAHIALWLGFALMSLRTVVVIPFLAMLAVPIIAAQVNAISSRITLQSWGDPKTRFLLLGSVAGRFLTLAVLLTLCVFAWPGWVHAPVGNPAFTRRVAWGIEPDSEIVRAAEQLQTWRASNRLPASARGLILSAEFANYCAWYAPLEKVYLNSRYNHHKPELTDFMKVRVGMGLVPVDDRQNPRELIRDRDDVLRNLGVEYVVLHASPGDGALRGRVRASSQVLWSERVHWSAWYLDGRTTVGGWRDNPQTEKPTFAALRVDPVMLAFGPQVVKLPPGQVQPIPAHGGWEEDFIRSPNASPPGADETEAWLAYKAISQTIAMEKQRLFNNIIFIATRVHAPFPPLVFRDDVLDATPILALRAARQAIATDPSHPDGYYALAVALSDTSLPMSESDRVIAQITAFRQCLERLPPPEDFHPGVYVASPRMVSFTLARLYAGWRQEYGMLAPGFSVHSPAYQILWGMDATGVILVEGNNPVRRPALTSQGLMTGAGAYYLLPLDLVRENLQKAERYTRVEVSDEKAREAGLAELKNAQRSFEAQLASATNSYEARRNSQKLPDQVRLALRLNLTGEALRLLTAKDLDVGREFGQQAIPFVLCRVSLELALGRLEDAALDLDQLAGDAAVQKQLTQEPSLQSVFRLLMYQRFVLEGNYAEAGALIEAMEGQFVGTDPSKPLRDKFDPAVYVALRDHLDPWAQASPFAALLSPTPFDLVTRLLGPSAALYGDQKNPGFLTIRNGLIQVRNRDADFFFRRGLLSLNEGDIPAARKRFLQTRLPAVKDWGMPDYRHPTAELYLRLIEEAEARAPK